MKAFVTVALKKTVLDPQGKTIHSALSRLGHQAVRDVRQGKLFEIDLDDSLTAEQARALVETIAKDVLTNPVIEEYSIHLGR
jgi:phosphoribosylformylglycinamidine synthase